MASKEFKGHLISHILVVIIALITVFTIFLLESWARATILPEFNLFFNPTNESIAVLDNSKPEPAAALMFATIILNLLKIIKIILLMTVVVVTVRFINQSIFESAISRTGQSEIGSLIKTIISVIIYIVSFFIIFQFQFPNVPLAPLFTGSTILGIVVGLALQDTLGNLFAGIAIQADQGFQVGDVISLKDQGTGVVESVSWRGIRIRTFQDKILLISNSLVGKTTIEIAPKANLNAQLVLFSTVYSNSPAKVIQVVRDVVRQVENVSPKRRPKVRIRHFGENGIDWEVKYWATNYSLCNDTDALIRERIWYAFQRENLEFSFPSRTIYNVTPSDSAQLQAEAADEIYERILNVPIFAPLSTEDTETIARGAAIRVFAPNEPIIKVGDEGKSMFIINHGSANVQIVENGEAVKVSTLHEGDFFGEMSLFSGEKRQASVISESETQVLEIKPYIIAPILENNPEVARVIDEIIAERRLELIMEEEVLHSMSDSEKAGIIKSLRRFLGLK